MVTAKTDSEDVVEALSLGANDYVTKPVDYPVALARIRAHLRTRQALRRRRRRRRDRAAEPRAGGAGDRPGRPLPARRADRRRQLRDRFPRAPPRARPRGGGQGPGHERRHRPRGARALPARGRLGLPRAAPERGRGPRLRRQPGRRRLPRDGAARGPLAREGARGARPGCRRGAAPRSWSPSARRSPPPTPPASCTATSSPRTCSCTGRRTARCRRSSTSGSPRWRARRRSARASPSTARCSGRPPTWPPSASAAGPTAQVRHLQRRRDALRDAVGPAAVHPEHRRPARARGDAGRGGPAAAARALPRGFPRARGAGEGGALPEPRRPAQRGRQLARRLALVVADPFTPLDEELGGLS